MATVSSPSPPAASIVWTGAVSAVLAGFANVVSGLTDAIIMNHPSIAAYWLTDLAPLAFTFLVAVSATLFSTAIAVASSKRLPICLVTIIACVVVGIGVDVASWYFPAAVWVTSWIDMFGRVILVTGIELAILLVLVHMVRVHVPRPAVTDNSREELVDVAG